MVAPAKEARLVAGYEELVLLYPPKQLVCEKFLSSLEQWKQVCKIRMVRRTANDFKWLDLEMLSVQEGQGMGS